MSNTRETRLANRNSKICKRYNDLRGENYEGIQLYNQTAILAMLAEEFYLSPRTVEDIVFGRHKY